MWASVPNVSLNGTGPASGRGSGAFNVALFASTLVLSAAALLGGLCHLSALLSRPRRTAVALLVAAWSVDDLIGAASGVAFLSVQWARPGPAAPPCAAWGLLYLGQGLASSLKAPVLAGYHVYTTMGPAGGAPRASTVPALASVLAVWGLSLALCLPPLAGWGAYLPTPWGCLVDRASGQALVPVSVFALAFGLLAALAVPLTPRLLCSEEDRPGRPPPETPAAAARRVAGQLAHGTAAGARPGRREPPGPFADRSAAVAFAQKRFSLILALTKVVLWLPMMIQILVQHVGGYQSSPFENLSFLLTLLAATVTPVFVLSEHWIHFPCGCIINCRRNAYAVASEESKTKRRGFEFSLSFQQGYGIYKIAHDNLRDEDENSISYHNLISCESETPRETPKDSSNPFHAQPEEFSTILVQDSSILTDTDREPKPSSSDAKQDTDEDKATERVSTDKTRTFTREDSRNLEKTTNLEGPERRLSHEESRKPELSDWEWCRSKSERTPRQRSGGALAIPLCAFQGTVSLHAPTGKTLSLSTYEVSTEGQKITPASKKIEVYRSKSVGHEPNPEDLPTTFADTSVKIHLEVLEICDNEEAMDTVSIISNISQSSTQVRSPSLRYSRKENRFVSCDLGESASYSLFIPTNNPDSDINISIPDTVEAHRQNSKKQHLERDGYQEEIQLLNKAYRKREGDDNCN
uniref:G protein-coupled receptor 149 n=1 Tax=Ornithorhynchus anatinus TaxID=9258 RepID=A0A6I8N258_ORNAN